MYGLPKYRISPDLPVALNASDYPDECIQLDEWRRAVKSLRPNKSVSSLLNKQEEL